MPSRRPERISGLLLQAVSEILLREVKDPRINGVTLTAASISPDLKEATVFFRTLHNNAQDRAEDDAEGEHTDVEAGLRSATGYIRRHLATRLQLRRTPQIRFQYDTTLDQANHMESLLQQARNMSAMHSEQEQQEKDSECPE
jgi:ribosome-binding factor A